MMSLADEVKALIAMGIPPTEALAAVTADRERKGNNGSSSGPESSLSSKSDNMSSNTLTGLSRPLSYNRPGMITHTHVKEVDTDVILPLPAVDEENQLCDWLSNSMGLSDSESTQISKILASERITSKDALVKTLIRDKTYFVSGESKVPVRHGKLIMDRLRDEQLIIAPTRSTISYTTNEDSEKNKREQSPQRNTTPLTSTPLSKMSRTPPRINTGGNNSPTRESVRDRESPRERPQSGKNRERGRDKSMESPMRERPRDSSRDRGRGRSMEGPVKERHSGGGGRLLMVPEIGIEVERDPLIAL